MQKSLFTKYLIMTMSVVLASFVVLGFMMMYFFSSHWKSEKELLLSENVLAVAKIAESSVIKDVDNPEKIQINTSSLNVLLQGLSQNADADIFITNLDGERIIGEMKSTKKSEEEKVPERILETATSGYYSSSGDFGGMYGGNRYTVGVPITINNSDNSKIIVGLVFASANASGIFDYLISTFQIFMIAALISLFITFIVVWMFTYRMVRPLRKMSIATKAFATGDFSVRVPVETEDEVGQLSLALNNMANSLSNSEGMRRSFIANVSHELKTPMTTIAGFIDGVLDGTIEQSKQRQYLHIVSDEIKRLSRLVKSMLDLSRIDSGEMKINLVKFDLASVVFNTILTFEQRIDEKQIDIFGLEDAPPMMIDGDQDLLHQVVYNLIENAVKFTNEKGYIRFGFSDCFDRLCFSIQNSGHGISPDDLPMIFDKFYKTDKSRSQDKNGMGLGLYLVKTIINLHGGEITAQSSINGFSKFEFFIPKIVEKNLKTTDKKIINIAPSEDIQDIE